MNAKCSCQNCQGEFEFDVADFKESNRIGNMIFGQTVLCPLCERETSIYLEESKSLANIATTPAPANESSPERTPGSISKETVFFQSNPVAVTNARFVIGQKTFAMRGITSVEAIERIECDETAPRTLIQLVGFAVGYFVGSLFIIVGILLATDENYIGMAICLLIALLIIGISSALAVRKKRVFSIILKTASGDVSAYTSADSHQVHKIVQALNDSIVSQG